MRKNYRFWVRLITPTLFSLVLGTVARTSDNSPTDSTLVDTVTTVRDTLVTPAIDTILFISNENVSTSRLVTNPTDLEQHLSQQPTTALFKSMLVPGLGQLGNRRYFKAALFGGLEIWFISEFIHYKQQTNEARDLYENATDNLTRKNLYYVYDSKRKDRNKYAWFAGLTIFVSMFDAYVDAHLSGSPADPQHNGFEIDVAPVDEGGFMAVLNYRF